MTPWQSDPSAPPVRAPRPARWWLLGGLAGIAVVTVAVLVIVLATDRGGTPSAGTLTTSAPTPSASRAPTASEPTVREPTASPPTASPPTQSPSPPPTAAATTPPVATLGGLQPTVTAADAIGLLAALPVAAEVLPGYDRDSFGPSWSDIDGNGCNQRDDVLLRDVMAGTARTAAQDACDHDVLGGQWLDPYTGTVLTFDDLKAPDQAQALQIDHLVPLAEAHRSGAYEWTADQKEQFANDLDNLVAVGGAENSSKGDSDPAEWLPPTAVECAYVVIWVAVKAEYLLAVDPAESAAISRVLGRC